MAPTDLLFQAGVVFAVLAVGGAVADRYGQSVIPAYIVAGIVVGPNVPQVFGYSFVLVETREFIDLLAELGIVFLLFFIGLEFNLERLAASRDRILGAGAIDVGINGAVGAAIGFALGFSGLESLFLAGIVAISSSAIITKTLIDLGWIADPESEAILGLLVFEDVVVAVYLAVVTAVAVGGNGGGGVGGLDGVAGVDLASLDPTGGVGVSIATSLAVLLALVALAVWGTPLLERYLRTDSNEQFLVRVVAAAAGVAGLALVLGVSEAVAAFFVGTAFGATDHTHRIERVITSERDLYAAVFFFAIGLETDPALVASVLEPLAALAAVTAASKLVSGYWGGRTYGLSERRSRRVAVAMVARGEFSLVIAALAARPEAGLANGDTIAALAVGYVLVMGVLGTVLMSSAESIERRFFAVSDSVS